jgi:BirA family biotin operon repressor/biotin-[acetyl-CoA-carboxylase] ligase
VAWLRPGDPPAPTLALVAGVAVHRAVVASSSGLGDLTLKWPNDLMLGVDGGWAKLAGLLLERRGEAVVVGVGVNLARAPDLPDRATASLAGFAVDRDRFADTLAAHWAQALARWHAGDWPGLRAEWLARAHGEGTPLSVRGRDGAPLHGTFAGLADDGAALLRLASGSISAIHAGDVELVRNDAAGD